MIPFLHLSVLSTAPSLVTRSAFHMSHLFMISTKNTYTATSIYQNVKIMMTQDELMWGAAWLLKATDELSYENFIKPLGGGDRTDIFNWDNKYAGAYVLLSQVCLSAKRRHVFFFFY